MGVARGWGSGYEGVKALSNYVRESASEREGISKRVSNAVSYDGFNARWCNWFQYT